MLLEFLECGFSFADAYRELMSASAMIDDASCEDKDSWLVGDVCGERINLEGVICVLSPE